MSMRVWRSLVLLVAGCSFDGGGFPSGAQGADAAVADALAPGDDGGGVARTVRHDTADDFGAATARLDQAVIEPWGAIGPAPRVVGALLAHAVGRRVFTDADDAEWADLPAPTATSLLAPPLTGAPDTLSLPGQDWTLWLEGEIWLEAGVHQWQLAADDDGFVEIAAATGAGFQRIAVASYTDDGAGTSTAAAPGWYRVRIALAQGVGDTDLDLRHRGPNDAAMISLPAYRYRAALPPTPAITGLLAQGFDDRRLLVPRTVALHRGDALHVDYATRAPTTLGIGDGDSFAVRWTGQLRVDVAGPYTLRLASDDGQRLTVDGRRLLDHWTDATEDHSVTVDLDVGWHDVAIDLRENATAAAIDLEVTASPDGAGSALGAARLRPTLVRTARIAANRRNDGGGVPDNDSAGVASAIAIAGPADAVVTAVDLTVDFSHGRHSDLEIALRAPNGTEHIVAAPGRLTGAGMLSIAHSTVALAGVAAVGTWSVIVRDRVAQVGGSVGEVALTVHHRGGESPVATTATYESAVIDLGAVVGFDRARWTARTGDGSTVVIRARSCDASDGCGAEPWSTALALDAAPPVLPRRFFQYRVELTTRGDAVPALDLFELAYRAAE